MEEQDVTAEVQETAPESTDSSPDEGGEPQAPKHEESIPYERFSQVNRDKKRWENEAKSYQQKLVELESQLQRQNQDAIIDPDTDRAVETLAQRATKQEIEAIKRAMEEDKASRTRQQIESLPDWEKYGEKVLEEYATLQEQGFSGVAVAKALMEVVKSREGVFRQEGKQEAQRQQDMRAAAGGAGGSAPKEPTDPNEGLYGPDGRVTDREAFRQLVAKVKREGL